MLLSPKSSLPYVVQTWKNWQPEFEVAAEEYKVPAVWLLAVATTESGLWAKNPEKQRTISSSEGAIGIMQIMPMNAPMLKIAVSDLFDPLTNIRGGAKIFTDAVKGKAGDYVAATAPYNSGKLCQTGRNPLNLHTASVEGVSYPELTLRYVNSAILELGLLGEKTPSSPWPWVFAGGVGLAAFFWLRR